MKNHSSYCVIWYFWWGCRRNLKLILEVKGSKGRLVVMTASAGTRRHREEYPLVLSASFSSCPLSVFEGASSFCSCRRHTGKKGEDFVGWTSPRHHCTFSSRWKQQMCVWRHKLTHFAVTSFLTALILKLIETISLHGSPFDENVVLSTGHWRLGQINVK